MKATVMQVDMNHRTAYFVADPSLIAPMEKSGKHPESKK